MVNIELTDEDGNFLVKLARKSIEEYLKSGTKVEYPKEIDKKFLEKRGVFVTLKNSRNDFELRGCIGYPYPTKPLVEATIDSAIEAATNDPRFYPVSPEELKNEIVVEVSILTSPKLITVEKPEDYPKHIKIGEDGLIVERELCKGLLLPQVATEWGWNEEDFLSNCCMKAGLQPDFWLLKGTKVYKFQAIIFEEKTPDGKVERKKI
ncbi:MAG: TIGR00296 family protein [Candidatus Bathyarchaeia archaeon]